MFNYSMAMNRHSYQSFLYKYFPLQGYYNNLQIQIGKQSGILLRQPMSNNVLKTVPYGQTLEDEIIMRFKTFKPEPMDESFQFQYTLNLILLQENDNDNEDY